MALRGLAASAAVWRSRAERPIAALGHAFGLAFAGRSR
jgi:hypothetical protein